jgi:hypothetical protein
MNGQQRCLVAVSVKCEQSICGFNGESELAGTAGYGDPVLAAAVETSENAETAARRFTTTWRLPMA